MTSVREPTEHDVVELSPGDLPDGQIAFNEAGSSSPPGRRDDLWLADYQDGGARDDVALLAVRVGPI
jgi:hypothetical protein